MAVHLPFEDRLRVYSDWKREGSGEIVFLYLKGAYKKAGYGHFIGECSSSTRCSSFHLKEVRLRVRMKFFT